MKKRILFITPRLGQGGAEKQIVTVACNLKRLDYEIEVLCYSYGNFFEEMLLQENIPVYWKQYNYLLRIITCTRFIRRGKYDVVISFLPTPSFVNCFAAMLGKRWRVITGERSSVVRKPKTLREIISSWIRRYSDVIICNSNNARLLWEECYPQYKNKLKTIYNTVYLGSVHSDYLPHRNNKLNIIIAASIYGTKNPIGLINAILLMTSVERTRLVIDWYGKNHAEIGNTQIYDQAVKLIKEYHLQDILHLNDATKDIANCMNQADCVALFSDHEGLPNAICEGMLMGKIIVMTRVSDYNNLVEEGINGFLCDWDKPETIKKALLKAADLSTEAIIEMGNISRLKAEKLFASDKILNQWIDVIEGR